MACQVGALFLDSFILAPLSHLLFLLSEMCILVVMITKLIGLIFLTILGEGKAMA